MNLREFIEPEKVAQEKEDMRLKEQKEREERAKPLPPLVIPKMVPNKTNEALKPWIVKYLPRTTAGVFGRDEQLDLMRNFIVNFRSMKKKAIFLAGPAGSGKTSCTHALAKELDYELFEVNASDVRNKSKLQELLIPAVSQKSFFYKGKIVLMDEVDGVSGTKDRGGLVELAKIIQMSAVPIILTGNEVDPKKHKALLKIVELVEMPELSSSTMRSILEHVAEKESIEQNDDYEYALSEILKRSDGDARAAINDLQLVVLNGKVDRTRFDMIFDRHRTQTIEQTITTVLKGSDMQASVESLYNIKEDFDTYMLWIDHNMGEEYTDPSDRARAYGALSKADVFRARIRKNQEWRFIVYAQILASAGVSIAKKAPYSTRAQYKQTMRLLKIWQIKMANAKKNAIALKLAELNHCSTRRAIEQIPYLQHMCKVNSEQHARISEYLDLDSGESAWLVK